MRRITKLSLLLAPLMLASISGCATPRWMSSAEPTDPRESRVNRLLAVAAEYEKEGKPDAAMRVYEHVIAQQPEHPLAKERRDLLAQQGVKSGGRSLKPQSGMLTPELYASAKKSPAVEAKGNLNDVSTEIHRKNAELNKLLTQQKTQAQPLVAMPGDPATQNNGLKPTPAPEMSLAATSKNELQKLLNGEAGIHDPGWTSTVSGSGWNVVSDGTSKQAADGEFKPAISPAEDKWVATSAATKTSSEKKSSASDDAAGWTVADSKAKKTADTQVETKFDSTVAKTAVEEQQRAPQKTTETTSGDKSAERVSPVSLAQKGASESGWSTSDLTRAVKAEAAPTTDQSKWSTTRLADLCDHLSPELLLLVEKLESKDPAERVSALLALGEQGMEARSASVAVYSLMDDKDPIVAVYAAGTMRQITGDAWSSVHTLTTYLGHADPGIAQLSAYLLGQMGPEAMDAVPALEKLRNGSSDLTSLHAAEALTHIAPGDTGSVEKLTAAISSANREVRWFAAVSLGTVAGECESKAAEALKRALQDQEQEVQVAACLSLGGLGSHAAIAIPDLERAAASSNPEVKSAAETALACLKG